MRRRIIKNKCGRRSVDRKEVALRINKSGLSANGEQRYVVAVRFTADSYKKASNTGYVTVEVDDDLNRVYFAPSTSDEGYKLTCSTKNGTWKCITFTDDNIKWWREIEGDYNLLKDVAENLYYIDINGRKEV